MTRAERSETVYLLIMYDLYDFWISFDRDIWDKVFKNGPNKVCGRQRLKDVKGYGLL